jgi:hypothetical protein
MTNHICKYFSSKFIINVVLFVNLHGRPRRDFFLKKFMYIANQKHAPCPSLNLWKNSFLSIPADLICEKFLNLQNIIVNRTNLVHTFSKLERLTVITLDMVEKLATWWKFEWKLQFLNFRDFQSRFSQKCNISVRQKKVWIQVYLDLQLTESNFRFWFSRILKYWVLACFE